ncbi:MAG TPA: signal peptidase I [Candidatus Saccharimonadales bacterium]|jgi:signal peptidase I
MFAFLQKHQGLKDLLSIVGFILAVIVGAALINMFLFRTFSVSGPSMEPTLYTGDRLIVNRVTVSLAHLQANDYVPKRGQVIVFKNPHWLPGGLDEYIVKRVIAFPGERVVLAGGVMKVFNDQHPDGILVDEIHPGPSSPTAGEVDQVIPDKELFVSGDHRQEGYSLDSRNGLGTIPYHDLIGPVALRIFPFSGFRTF